MLRNCDSMGDKMFTGFVSYDGGLPGVGSGGAGYAFCGAVAAGPTLTHDAACSDAASSAVVPQHAPVHTLHQIHIEINPLQRTYSRIKKEQHASEPVRPPPYPPPPPTPQLPSQFQPAAAHTDLIESQQLQTCQPSAAIAPSPSPCLASAPPDPQLAPAAPYYTHVVPDVSITYVDQSITTKVETRVQYPKLVGGASGGGGRRRGAVADPASWAGNVRKLRHQRGEAYVSRRGKVVPPRSVRNVKDCLQSCKLHCSQFLGETDRQHIFKAFYSLNSNEKKHFLLNTTERTLTKRPTKMSSFNVPKRKYSFKYFFLVRAVRYNVCKSFYLGTLAISQKPVYNVHEHKSDLNIPKPDGRGHSDASTHAVSQELKDAARKHIMSYPLLESASSRPSKKQFLDSSLTVKKMFRAYADLCTREGRPHVKESMYRKIFNTDFNLHFKKRKAERCDTCKTVLKNK